MNDRRWIRITATGNIPLREGRAITLGTREIAVFNLGDRFLAIDNRCPHEGGPICDGIVTGTSVVCPLHAWKISLETGAVERPGGAAPCLRTYAARVEDGIVLLEIPMPAEASSEGAAA
jgi:nitrite reductase (NADH) small subunit